MPTHWPMTGSHSILFDFSYFVRTTVVLIFLCFCHLIPPPAHLHPVPRCYSTTHLATHTLLCGAFLWLPTLQAWYSYLLFAYVESEYLTTRPVPFLALLLSKRESWCLHLHGFFIASHKSSLSLFNLLMCAQKS